LAAIAARLVSIRSWERLGFARLRDYAVERAGMSARQVQDLAHVDSAFARLPACEAAFLAGSLSWTQARLIARVATPEDEAHWIGAAQRMTARALAREMRALDVRAAGAALSTDEDGTLEELCESVSLRCTPVVRAKVHRARQLARRVTGESLPNWACMEAVAAEVLSAVPLDGRALEGLPPLQIAAAEAEWPWSRSGRGRRPGSAFSLPSDVPCTHLEGALPAFLRNLVRGLDDADAFDLDARLRRAMKLEQAFEAQLAPLLLNVASRRGYRALGFANLDDYVRERLGMSPRKAQALLRLERTGARCPELRAAFRSGALSWVQAQALVPVVRLAGSGPWHEAWVEHAGRVSVRRLEEDVEHAVVAAAAIGAAALDPGSLAGPDEVLGAAATRDPQKDPREDPQTGAPAKAPESTASTALTARFFFSGPRDAIRLFRAVLATVQRRIERREGRMVTESEAVGLMLEHFLAVWGRSRIPKAHAVFERDGWRCTVPGCTSYRNLHDHHIRFRSAGGSNDLANRTTLCAWHHLRGVHAGLVRCQGTAPAALRFGLGLRSGQPALLSYVASDVIDVRMRPAV
jgi:hypothetical protein